MDIWHGKALTVVIPCAIAGVAQQIWIGHEQGAILVDVGDGALRDLLDSDLKLDLIEGLLVTHGHYDHVGGLHSLLGFMRMKGRTDALQIIGPRGCIELDAIVETFTRCYPDSTPFTILRVDISDRQKLEVAGMTVQAYDVVHCGSIEGSGQLDRIPAVGYRISLGDETVAISGDTGLCPSLQELVTGADLAVIEATFPDDFAVGRDILDNVHLNEKLAREVGKLAREYILVHRIPRHNQRREP